MMVAFQACHDHSRLSKGTHEKIDPAPMVFIAGAVGYDIGVKYNAGKLKLPVPSVSGYVGSLYHCGGHHRHRPAHYPVDHQTHQSPSLDGLKSIRIDMDEYAKAGPGEVLRTYGVSTCTAVAIVLPNRFGHMVHISPHDRLYDRNGFWKALSGDAPSDFLGALTQRIQHYDVYPYELKQLQFVITAPHRQSYFSAVDQILETGVELGNITLLYDPRAQGANLAADISSGAVHAQWYDGRSGGWSSSKSVENLESVVKKLAGYNS